MTNDELQNMKSRGIKDFNDLYYERKFERASAYILGSLFLVAVEIAKRLPEPNIKET